MIKLDTVKCTPASKILANNFDIMGVYSDDMGDYVRYDIEVLLYGTRNNFTRVIIHNLVISNELDINDYYFDYYKVELAQLILSSELDYTTL